jgi:GNAT superfamily N-acetyltransferase
MASVRPTYLMSNFSIEAAVKTRVSDQDLEELLKEVYVGGGFTEPSVAEALFCAAEVRARGEVLVARDHDGALLGMVITVLSGSPACRFARAGEAELQLLCVRPTVQRRGVGGALVEASIAAARRAGAKRVILWTQPLMEDAQRLYLKHGFEPNPALDFSRDDRSFRVLVRSILDPASDGRGDPES